MVRRQPMMNGKVYDSERREKSTSRPEKKKEQGNDTNPNTQNDDACDDEKEEGSAKAHSTGE